MNIQSEIGRLPALQYDFLARWRDEVVPLFERPDVEDALMKIKDKAIDMYKTLHEDGDLGEGREGDLYYLSNIFKVEAHYKTYHWLREVEAFDLMDFTLALAKELKPDEEWEIVETDDIHSVVTNPERSMVFDLRLHDRLSAEESLLYAGDKKIAARRFRTDRLDAYREEKLAFMQRAIEKMKADIARFDREKAAVPTEIGGDQKSLRNPEE